MANLKVMQLLVEKALMMSSLQTSLAVDQVVLPCSYPTKIEKSTHFPEVTMSTVVPPEGEHPLQEGANWLLGK